MEFMLILYVCASTSTMCSPALESELRYQDLYDCLTDGYKKAIIQIEKVGRDNTNNLGISVKFECKKDKSEEA